MKVIIQIPCFNEEGTLARTLADLPRELPGVDAVEWLIIDDGSTDRTIEVARAGGVDHIVRFRQNRGLAFAFEAGIDACLRLGADVIVNTDGDNQYCGADIGKLVAPVVAGKADMVIGDREVEGVEHFSWLKKRLQRLGSGVVRRMAGGDVRDATSGFRAISREFALSIQLTNAFTYTLETIMQAGERRHAVRSVPIRTNEKLRESRLFRGVRQYVTRSAGIILRIYTMHRPLRAFLIASIPFFLVGLVLVGRFLYYYFSDPGVSAHIQSLVIAAVFLLLGGQFVFFGLLGDLIAANRRLQEETLRRVKRLEVKSNPRPPDLLDEDSVPSPAEPGQTEGTQSTESGGP